MAIQLTEMTLRRLLREPGDHTDAGCPGLQVRVGRNGAASWRVAWRDPRTGRKERLRLGSYPAVSLAEARRRAHEVLAKAKDPIRPTNVARELRERRSARTFREVALERLEADGEGALAERSREYYRWALAKHAFPVVGDVPLRELRREDVAAVVDRAARGGALVTADRTRAAVSSVLTWAQGRGLVDDNVARGLSRRAAPAPRARVLDERELRLVLAYLAEGRPSRDTALLLSVLLYSGARSSEVRLALASDLRWDGHGSYRDAPCWVVPGDHVERGRRVRGRSKGGSEIVRPLPPRLAALFREACAGKDGDERLFGHSDHRAVSRAVARMCARLGVSPTFTAHDWRRSASTFWGEVDVRTEVQDLLLGHSPSGGGVTRVHYDHSLRLGRMHEALEMWERHLCSMMDRAAA